MRYEIIIIYTGNDFLLCKLSILRVQPQVKFLNISWSLNFCKNKKVLQKALVIAVLLLLHLRCFVIGCEYLCDFLMFLHVHESWQGAIIKEAE